MTAATDQAKHVLVTGAAGMLGQDLTAHLRSIGDRVTGIDMEVDIRDLQAVRAALYEHAPDAVIHCAAWTDVDGAENDEDAAYAVNALGAEHVAIAAAELGVPLVMLSTDYVFDGSLDRDYLEADAPAPIGAYGRTKLAGELAVRRAHPAGARIARTAWLYGAAGRNFVDTMRRLGGEQDEVAVVADQIGSPTWTRDLAPALRALITAEPGVHHTTGAGSVSWAGFAEAVFDTAGLDCRVRPITTAELARPAPRPPRSVLAATRPDTPPLRHWRDALADYISETS
ncbi:MAG: dTDP-4-dehydrorhamnose reductase [Thermoleophilia bacterium]